MNIEPLESRIAPAAVTTFTFTDVDGDIVKVSNSAGGAMVKTLVAKGLGEELQLLDLTAASNAGANITFTVTKKPGGDGLVNVGRIDAGTNALGNVTVPGDLAVIDAGNGTVAVKTLSVRSMGKVGLATQGAGADLHSDLNGTVGALNVKGDVDGVTFVALGAAGSINAVNIGGSLLGSSADFSGEIHADASLGVVKIGHDVIGGSGNDSGYIESLGKIRSLIVGGSVIGGSGSYFEMASPSAQIFAKGDIDMVKIGGDLMGGVGADSGSVQSLGSMGKNSTVSIGRGVIGGDGPRGGSVISSLSMGKVSVGRDVQGAAGIGSGEISSATADIASVTIGGSIVGASGQASGRVAAKNGIGAAKIAGSVIGGAGKLSGDLNGGDGKLGVVTIGGSLIGGSNDFTGVVFADSGIASISVGGSVIGGSFNGDGSGKTRSETGTILSIFGVLGPVKIGGDLVGGSITSPGTDTLERSGYIQGQRITSVTIGGSLIGATTVNGSIDQVGSIRATEDIGAIVVKGGIQGHESGLVIISAKGQAVPTGTSDVAIKSLSVGGNVGWARILGGYGTVLTAGNGNAQIGAVKVGGDWASSSLVAGLYDKGAHGFFGTGDDDVIAGGTIAKIASVTIAGIVTGSGPGNFGIESHTIGVFKSGGVTLPFTLAGTFEAFPLSRDSGNVFAFER